jgi:O-antigen/teichoic acid export membrane protein
MTERRLPSFQGRRLVWAGFAGLLDQALLSAANFLTIVILARELTPPDFGAFVLAYTGLVLLNGLQTALVTQPHNVLGHGRTFAEYPAYTSSTAAGQALFTAPFAALALFAAFATQALGADVAPILFALVPALIAWQAQEFVRRVLYTEGRLRSVAVTDVLSYGGQVAVLLVLSLGETMTPARALYVVAATSTVGALYGTWAIRPSLTGRIDRAILRENWEFGKWLGAAIAASWLATHLYVYLTAVTVGAGAAGALKAAQIVLGPVNAFLLFLATVLPIRFAATRDGRGDRALDRDVRRAYLVTVSPVLVYGALAAALAGPILGLFYGDTYRDYTQVVLLFSVYYVLMHVTSILTAALTAKRQTRALFKGSAYAGLLGVAVGWLLIEAWGVEGAVVGMIATSSIVNVVFWRAHRRSTLAAEGRSVEPATTRA